MDAPLDAAVSIVDDCVLLDNGENRFERAIWPAGTDYDPETDTLRSAEGVEFRDGDRILGSGGSEAAIAEYDEEARRHLFQLDSFTEFTLNCRAEDVTADRVFMVGPGTIADDVSPGHTQIGIPYLLIQTEGLPQLDAPLRATISIENDCVLLRNRPGDAPEVVLRALWPFGTTYDPETSTIRLADGTALVEGVRIEGGGGAEGPLTDLLDGVVLDGTASEFTRTCRSGEVTSDDIFIIGAEGLSGQPSDD